MRDKRLGLACAFDSSKLTTSDTLPLTRSHFLIFLILLKSPTPLWLSIQIYEIYKHLGAILFQTTTVCLTSETLSEKANFSFASGCQQLLGQGWGPMSISTFSTGTPPDFNLCRLCMLPQSLLVHNCVGPVLSRRSCFLGALHPLWILQSLHLLFCRVP